MERSVEDTANEDKSDDIAAIESERLNGGDDHADGTCDKKHGAYGKKCIDRREMMLGNGGASDFGFGGVSR